MTRRYSTPAIAGWLICALFWGSCFTGTAQKPVLGDIERQQVSGMLQNAYNEVKKHYYDPNLQGLDWDARYKQYAALVGKANSLGDGFAVVSGFLSGLHDSHTFFTPPRRATRLDSGYRLLLVGNDCFISRLRPKTDAESKLHIGDRVLGIDGFKEDRASFYTMQYYFDVLAPQQSQRIAVQSPSGEQHQTVVNALVRYDKRVLGLDQGDDYMNWVRESQDDEDAMSSRIIESGDVAIWKLQQFDMDIDKIEKGFNIARKHKTLILDLRGNPGGAVKALEIMVGSLFDHDIKIADRVRRKETKPLIAKHHGHAFEGKLIVLVDAGSASGSELLARVVQLEHRGTVIGDRTSGKVMEAIYYDDSQGTDTMIFYGFNVTDANLIMSDGQSLEKKGVVPDELLLPTGADLAAGRDPVLTRAADLAGIKLDPGAAGKLFPFVWLHL
jgi:C-terminal processing protease CtpA/Prc